jgi:hypothetical protein
MKRRENDRPAAVVVAVEAPESLGFSLGRYHRRFQFPRAAARMRYRALAAALVLLPFLIH